MIQAFIVKIIFKSIFKAIQKKREWKRMEDYVKKPNELDKKVHELENSIAILNKCLDLNDSDIKKLKKVAHTPKDFVCLKCGCKAKKIKLRRK